MKLLTCKSCHAIFSLSSKTKKCTCGKSKGKYVDELIVEVSGPCLVLAIDANDFARIDETGTTGLYRVIEPNALVERVDMK